MKTLLIYAIGLIVLPSFTQAEKIRIKPEDFVQFRSIAEKKSYKHSFMHKNQFAHEKKVYSWDRYSSNWEMNLRTEFEFSPEGLIKKEIQFDAENQAFVQYIRKYNAEGRMVVQEDYSLVNNEWQIMSTQEFQFDALGRELLQEQRILRNNEWLVHYGIKHVYDSLNANTSTITQLVFDMISNKYTEQRKETHEFANGILTSIVYQVWENGTWLNEQAEAYDFDGSNKITAVTIVNWDGSQWINAELIYNIVWENYALQHPAEYHSKTWEENKWDNERKTFYTYSANGGVTALEMKLENGEWKNDFRFVDEFDANKNRKLLKIESYENNGWIVQFENQYVHTYDSQQRLIETITKMYDGFTWMNVMKEEYGQYKIGTGFSSTKKLNAQVFPNPFTEYINFSIDEKSGRANVRILDLSGGIMMMQELELNTNNQVQVQEIPNGIYLLQVEIGGKVYTEKIVKKGE